jgi:hypothetical protein
VALSATVFLALRRWLGDAGWDWFLRANFAAPHPNVNQAVKPVGTPE